LGFYEVNAYHGYLTITYICSAKTREALTHWTSEKCCYRCGSRGVVWYKQLNNIVLRILQYWQGFTGSSLIYLKT